MTTAGTTVRERMIADFSVTSAGARDIKFTHEHDGVLLVLQQTSGSAVISAELFMELPSVMDSLSIHQFPNFSHNELIYGYFITTNVSRLHLEYTGTCTIRAFIKPLSGSAIMATQASDLHSANKDLHHKLIDINQTLANQSDQLSIMINQLRAITGINLDCAETF